MLINYRHYTTKAMLEILTRQRVYFSRSSFFERGRFRQPDIVSLRVSGNAGRLSSGIIIECEVYNNLESNGDILRQREFLWDEFDEKHCKLWTIPFRHALEADALVAAVVAGLDEAERAMPLLTYASPAMKALADYHRFMTADIPKTSYGELVQHLGYWDESRFSGNTAEAGDTEREFLIAKYKRGRWAAWVGGDLVVPLFASEIEAIQFLKNRAARFCRQNPAIGTLFPVKNGSLPNVYVLVDHTKSVDERLAWLRNEINRLERQDETGVVGGLRKVK
jgi:hypothetical protein